MNRVMSFVVGVFIVLAMAIPAEAQYTGRTGYRGSLPGGWGGGGYNHGYYDPATIQQMMRLPDTLNSCQVDWSTGRVVSCHSIIKTADALMAFSQNPDGILTGIHIDGGKFHYRFLDDTNQRLGRGGAVTIGTAGGAVAGGVFGGRKGAVVGGGAGALAGWFTSRKFNRHDNCLIMDPAVAQSAGLSPAARAPSEEQGIVQPIVESVKIETEKKIVRNRFEDAEIRVYDRSKRIAELRPGDEREIPVDIDGRIWGEARIENPKNGKKEWTPLEIGRGINELPEKSGWVFGNPKTQPTL